MRQTKPFHATAIGAVGGHLHAVAGPRQARAERAQRQDVAEGTEGNDADPHNREPSPVSVHQRPAPADYGHIYFSPHLDDAVLSCAGRIARQRAAGAAVLVVTVFAGEQAGRKPAAATTLAPFREVAARRQEDRRALEALGADYRWLEFPDAIQRRRRYRSLPGITAPAAPRREADLAAALSVAVDRIVRRWPAAALYFPLAIGNHVDHQLVFHAGLRFPTRAVRLYEDVPYVCIPHLLEHRLEQLGIAGAPPHARRPRAPQPLARARATAAALAEIPLFSPGARGLGRVLLTAFLATRFRRGRTGRHRLPFTLIPELVRIDSVFAAKIEAIGRYRSQIRPLYGDAERLRQALAACAGAPAASDVERESAGADPSAVQAAPPQPSGPTPLHERYWRVAR